MSKCIFFYGFQYEPGGKTWESLSAFESMLAEFLDKNGLEAEYIQQNIPDGQIEPVRYLEIKKSSDESALNEFFREKSKQEGKEEKEDEDE